ncbi:MAG: response regulator [Lewinellaceae bacterium]|nr:response regulator [Lewinellaceae bacterium]
MALPFGRLTLEDGLPNPSVLDIIQDDQGFLWFGTLGGIVRYDGYAMQVYRPAIGNPDTLPVRNRPVLHQGPSGSIWLGYAWGDCRLFRYDPATDKFQPHLYDTLRRESLLPLEDGVGALYEDSRGRLLIGTYGGGVIAVEGQSFRQYAPGLSPSYPFPSTDVLGPMAEDGEGNIWMPTLDGLCKWEAGAGEFRLFRFSGSDNACQVVRFGPPSTLWVGTLRQGLIRFDVQRETFRQYAVLPDTAPPYQPVNAVAITGEGKVWMGIYSEQPSFGIQVLDPGTGRIRRLKNESEPELRAMVNSFCIDYAGNIWAGAWQAGILKYDPSGERFQRWNPWLPLSGRLAHPAAIALYEDRRGRVWISTESHGVVIWDIARGSSAPVVFPEDGKGARNNPKVRAIRNGRNGAIWAGTAEGVARFLPEEKRFIPYTLYWGGARLSDIRLWKTKQGKLWTSSWGFGICELNDDPGSGIRRCYTNRDSLLYPGIESVSVLKEGPQGRLWLGTNQEGLLILDPETGSVQSRLPEYGIHGIHFGSDGIAWLATHSSGFKGFDPATGDVIHLNPKDHELLLMARGILEDDHGRLWMLAPRGLARFDPESRSVVRFINKENWLAEEGRPVYSSSIASLKTRDGAMIYAGRFGAVRFHPDSLLMDTLPPRLAFTGLQLSYQPVRPGPGSALKTHISRASEVSFRHWQNDIGVQFAALHFKNPSDVRYRYRLAPNASEWIDIGSRNEVFFAGLAPGRYTLHVQAANADGFRNEEGIHLRITVLPPWWAAWWAYVLYGLLAFGIIFSLYRFLLARRLQEAETRRLRELDAFKARFYTNITHEFRTPLTIILGLSDQLQSKVKASFRPGLEKISNQGARLLRLVNQMLDLSKLEAGKLELNLVQADVIAYLRYLTESFTSLAESKDVQLRFRPEAEELAMDFDPDKLQDIVSNLLSNAVKFTPPGGSIWLRAKPLSPESFRVEVEDTGVGIAEEELPFVFDRFYSPASPGAPDGERPLRSSQRGEGKAPSQPPSEGEDRLPRAPFGSPAFDHPPPSGGAGGAGTGTGIGLALTRELALLMGGEVSVASAPGKGSCFAVELPITRTAPEGEAIRRPAAGGYFETVPGAEAAAHPDGAQREEDASLPLALVIEDHPDVRAYVRSCLEGLFRTEEAQNGREGLKKALELTPGLIISDVMMPEMDGFEVCRRLKTGRSTSHIPVILLTAKADTPSRLEGIEYGADAYLTKPFLAGELALRARKLLENRKRLHAYYQSMAMEPPPAASSGQEPQEAAFVLEAREMALQHLDDHTFNVNALADAMRMSRSQLHRKMGSLMGISPVQFLRNLRLASAQQMLRATDLPIAHVAYRCGYTDPSYFARIFQQEFGATPSEYRSNG